MRRSYYDLPSQAAASAGQACGRSPIGFDCRQREASRNSCAPLQASWQCYFRRSCSAHPPHHPSSPHSDSVRQQHLATADHPLGSWYASHSCACIASSFQSKAGAHEEGSAQRAPYLTSSPHLLNRILQSLFFHDRRSKGWEQLSFPRVSWPVLRRSSLRLPPT